MFFVPRRLDLGHEDFGELKLVSGSLMLPLFVVVKMRNVLWKCGVFQTKVLCAVEKCLVEQFFPRTCRRVELIRVLCCSPEPLELQRALQHLRGRCGVDHVEGELGCHLRRRWLLP